MDIMKIRQTAINIAKERDAENPAVDYKIEVSTNCDKVFGLYEDSKYSDVYHWMDTGVTTLDAETRLAEEV